MRTWHGKNMDDMTREELYEVIDIMAMNHPGMKLIPIEENKQEINVLSPEYIDKLYNKVKEK